MHLLKAGAQVGSNDASGSMYNDYDQTQYYGDDDDLWGTTWTAEEINASNFGLRFRVDSDTAASRTAYVDAITIRVTYLPPPDTSIGLSGANVLQAHVFDRCYYHTQAGAKPCTSADKVYATTITSTPSGLSKPQIDMDWWYDNAKPGPKHPCTTTVGTPPVWDNDSTYDLSLPVDDSWSEVTPTNRSYTCQVRDVQNNLLGELSWNHTTNVLTIYGTIFLDGDFRFDDNGQIAHYQGRGIIYAARDIEFDELVCAGGSGATNSCVTQAGGMSNWDPTVNMMTVLAGDDSEFDQGTGQAAVDALGPAGDHLRGRRLPRPRELPPQRADHLRQHPAARRADGLADVLHLAPARLAHRGAGLRRSEHVPRLRRDGGRPAGMSYAAAAFALAPGLAIGSFLNVVAARVPLKRSIVSPASACMSCGHELSWAENVPVLSYLALRGRCKGCGTKIGAVYPAVELADGAPDRRFVLRLRLLGQGIRRRVLLRRRWSPSPPPTSRTGSSPT